MFKIIVIAMLIGGVVGVIMGTLDGKEAKRKKRKRRIWSGQWPRTRGCGHKWHGARVNA